MTTTQAGDGYRKARTAFLSGIMIALFSVSVAPTAQAADECSDSSWGAGWEYPSCGFTCDAGETVYVAVSQEDDDYVQGRAECNSASAECVDYDGACDQRGATTAASGGGATCEGKVYSNWATDAHISCGSGDGAVDVLGLLPGLPGGGGGCADLPLLPDGAWRVVSMSKDRGMFLSPEGCDEFEPTVLYSSQDSFSITL